MERFVEITDLTDDDNFVEDTVTGLKLTYHETIELLNDLVNLNGGKTIKNQKRNS